MSDKKVTAYKATNKDLTCNGYQYAVGEKYEHNGEVRLCGSGFHACENPLDCLPFYDLTDSRFFVVEQSGEMHTDEIKTVSGKIEFKAELTLKGFVSAAFDFLWSRCSKNNASKVATSGFASKVATSGYASQVATSGDDSIALSAHKRCRVKVEGERSWMVITEWAKSPDGEDYIKKVWAVTPGHKIKGTVIEKGVWYWFGDDGELRSEK